MTKILTLRQARRLQDKTQKEMASLLKISTDTYRRIEEHPESATVEQAKKISEHLQVPYDYIFFKN